MKRPTIATVFGILNIIFSITGVIGLAFAMAMLSMTKGAGNPAIQLMQQSPGYLMWMKIVTPLSFAATLVLLVGGIGLLRVKPWGRGASIGYSIYAIIAGLAGMVVNYFLLVQPLLANAANARGPEAAGMIGGAIGGLIGGCFGVLYPIVLLIFMTRPKFIEAFRQAGQTPPA